MAGCLAIPHVLLKYTSSRENMDHDMAFPHIATALKPF